MSGPKNHKERYRVINIGDSKENSHLFMTNYISTTKYTAMTFLPCSLLIQFERYANIYFLFMAIL